MEFVSNANETLLGPDISHSSLAPLLEYAVSTPSYSPITFGVTAFLVPIVLFLASQAYRPAVHPKSPAFTTDTLPILGSFGFVSRQWSFWKGALAESKTGNFSFWQGKRHIVGVSGAEARKMFFEHPDLQFIAGQELLAFGAHFWPVHEIFSPVGNRARNNTHFLKTLLALLKTPRLERCLPGLIDDARHDFEALLPNNPSGVVNAPELWRAVFKQNTRLFFSDDFANDEKLFAKTAGYLDVLLHSFSPFYAFCNWIPEPSMIRRRLARWGLMRTAQSLYDQRKKYGSAYKDDPLQVMIDNGDPRDYITEFCTAISFISTINAHIITPQLINIMACHPDWQDKVFQEIVAAADRHSSKEDGALVDRLKLIPLSTWETAFPNLQLCLYEVIRVWTSFAVARRNMSPDPIPIPGSDEVIPGNTFAIYNSTELNFNPKLYPSPEKFDPLRFTKGREEFKQEAHGFFGWGSGMHPCAGQRWGKLQQQIILANALALYKWSSCDAQGNPDPHFAQRQRQDKELDSETKFALPPAYCKMEPRY